MILLKALTLPLSPSLLCLTQESEKQPDSQPALTCGSVPIGCGEPSGNETGQLCRPQLANHGKASASMVERNFLLRKLGKDRDLISCAFETSAALCYLPL